MIFVRHGRAVVQPDVPTDDWPLDPARRANVAVLGAVLPDRPVVCSDMRRAVETARFFGTPTIDIRLREVTRPWTDELEPAIDRYFKGESLAGWEPQAEARGRMTDAVGEHGDAIFVTHATVLSLYLASIMPGLDPMRFWSDLESPDAWQAEHERLSRLY